MLVETVRALSAALAFGMLASASVHAQTLPEPVERDGMTYVTGGIGADEVSAFREVASKYKLRITFTSTDGHYLSDIDVRISSGSHEVLGVHTTGPFLFVRLPKGPYRITARARHISQSRQVVVPARGGIDVRFHWDDPDRRGTMQPCRQPCDD
ncbi:carboxypeptidase regulatory-like domain-containing protein [Burkholderia gladioli]|uniref:carboxypeptidase regulatory-like domain-containing protein n=1 Tax=Burkholderia gladioli TaxID=28095 RepID=UPI00163DF987|nr:carboxypeptidase regulatory-like domain-containing protein [Burkholderia gladioli]